MQYRWINYWFWGGLGPPPCIFWRNLVHISRFLRNISALLFLIFSNILIISDFSGVLVVDFFLVVFKLWLNLVFKDPSPIVFNSWELSFAHNRWHWCFGFAHFKYSLCGIFEVKIGLNITSGSPLTTTPSLSSISFILTFLTNKLPFVPLISFDEFGLFLIRIKLIPVHSLGHLKVPGIKGSGNSCHMSVCSSSLPACWSVCLLETLEPSEFFSSIRETFSATLFPFTFKLFTANLVRSSRPGSPFVPLAGGGGHIYNFSLYPNLNFLPGLGPQMSQQPGGECHI